MEEEEWFDDIPHVGLPPTQIRSPTWNLCAPSSMVSSSTRFPALVFRAFTALEVSLPIYISRDIRYRAATG